MGAVAPVWFSTLAWTALTYGACMLFDMGMNYRVGLAYVAPEGAPTVNPKFWTGFSLRHIALILIALLIQYAVRIHTSELSPDLIWLLVLVVIYAGLFFRDFFKQVRSSARTDL